MVLENITRIKLDNHLIDMFKLGDIITIYFQYNNNYSSTTMYYNIKDKKYNANYNITERQKTILENYINKVYG